VCIAVLLRDDELIDPSLRYSSETGSSSKRVLWTRRVIDLDALADVLPLVDRRELRDVEELRITWVENVVQSDDEETVTRVDGEPPHCRLTVMRPCG
jgi:hypothetical protein